MRILYHAINGTGLGHIVRLTNIAYEIAELAPAVHQLFVAEGGAAFFQHAGLPFLLLPEHDQKPFGCINRRRRTVSNALTLELLQQSILQYKPHLSVFDTHFPAPIVDTLRRQGVPCALVLRECKDAYISSLLRKNRLEMFRRILIPHYEHEIESRFSKELWEQLRALNTLVFTGPIVRHFRQDKASISMTEEVYSLQASDQVVIISCGAGGYAHLTRQFMELAFAASEIMVRKRPGLKVLAVVGPYGPRMTAPWLWKLLSWTPDLPLLVARADLVITHGGYNSIHEILAAGSPAVVVSVPRHNEDQSNRVLALVEKGRISSVTLDCPADVAAEQMLNALDHPRFAPQTFHGARSSASELLSLIPNSIFAWTGMSFNLPAVKNCDNLDALLTELENCPNGWVVTDSAKLQQLLPMIDSKTHVSGWWVRLSGNLAEDLESQAIDALSLFRRFGMSTKNLTLTFKDDIGVLLVDLTNRLKEHSFHSLVAELIDNHPAALGQIAERRLEECRHIHPQFRVDMIENGGIAVIDQP